MFPEINALPNPKAWLALSYRNSQRRIGKYASHVCGHIVWTLAAVGQDRVSIWRQPREQGFEIIVHSRVRVLRDH